MTSPSSPRRDFLLSSVTQHLFGVVVNVVCEFDEFTAFNAEIVETTLSCDTT